MKSKFLVLAALVFSLMLVSCYPDLVVTDFETTGEPEVIAGTIEVPATLTIRNIGNMRSPIFKVCTEYTGPDGTYVMPFTVGDEIWYPMTTEPLRPGQEVTFEGRLVFTTVQDAEVSLEAIADCCSGDEFMNEYCRVNEYDEANNRSTPFTIVLPPKPSVPVGPES